MIRRALRHNFDGPGGHRANASGQPQEDLELRSICKRRVIRESPRIRRQVFRLKTWILGQLKPFSLVRRALRMAGSHSGSAPERLGPSMKRERLRGRLVHSFYLARGKEISSDAFDTARRRAFDLLMVP